MAQIAVNRFAVLTAVSLLGAGFVFSACSSDKNPGPSTPGDETGGKSSSGGKANASDSGAGGKGTAGSGGKSTGGSGGGGNETDSSTGGASPEAGSGGSGAGGADAGACDPPTATACGTCPAVTSEDHLNHCTDSKCTKFDNSKLKKLVNGKLPDLP